MKKCKNSIVLAAIVITGCLVSSLAATNPLGPLFPDLEKKIKIHRQTQHSHPAQTRATPRLSKRMAPGTGTISGTVTDLDSMLHSIKPEVSVIDTFGWEVAKLDCDNAGFYSVSGLYPGAYLVMSYTNSNAKYLGDSSAITYLGNTTNINTAKWIHMAAGQTFSGQDIIIARPAQPSKKQITISGKCYDGPGTAKPLSNVSLTVLIDPAGNNSLLQSSISDYSTTAQDGAFACTLSAAPGSYYGLVKASNGNTAFVPQWWDGSAISTEPNAFSFGLSTTGKEIHFERGGSISGVVYDNASDTLLDGVYVYAIDKDGYEINSDYCSDYMRDSVFLISGLPEGAYYLKVSSPYTSGPYVTTYYPQADSLKSATKVTVTAGSTTQNIRMTLKRTNQGNDPIGPKGIIKGKVVRQDNGAPIPDMDVVFTSTSDMIYSTTYATTDSLGNYSDSLIADSSYYVSAPDAFFPTETTQDYFLAPTWYPGVTGQSSATTVKVSPGSTQTVDIAVQLGGSIGGWARTSANTGFPNFMQSLYGNGELILGYAWNDDFNNVYTTYVGEMSGFRFCGVHPDTYTVRLISYNYNNLTGTGNNAGTDHAFASADGIVVTKENTALGRVITLPDGNAFIKGAAEIDFQNLNDPLYNVSIYCYAADSIMAGYASWMNFGNTNSVKGRFFTSDNFSLALPPQFDYSIGKLVPGKYAVARIALDTSTYEISRQWYGTTVWEKFDVKRLNEYYRHFLKPNIPSTAWLTLAANETKSGINFGNVVAINHSNSDRAKNAELQLLRGSSQKVALQYRLPNIDKNNSATLTIYRLSGARVKTISLNKPQGVVTWDGTNDRSASVAPGVYLYRLTGAGHTVTVKGAWVR